MTDIFREVDEALQRDRALAIWKAHGGKIVAAILLLLIAAAAWGFYDSWRDNRDRTATAQLLGAFNAEDSGAALEQLAQSEDAAPQIALARLAAAHRLADAGGEEAENADGENGPSEAIALYRDIYTERANPRDVRDLARIMAARLGRSAAGDRPQMTTEEAIAVLTPVYDNDDSPYQAIAALDLALLYGDPLRSEWGKAVEIVAPFTNKPAIPPSLQEKARALLHVFRLEQTAAAAAPQAGEGVPAEEGETP